MRTSAPMLAAILACLLTSAQAAPADTHAQAVAAARAGHFDEALPVLRRLVDEYPRERRFAWDLIAVLGWAGRAQDALDVAAHMPLDDAPVWVLEAVARAARDLRRWDEALEAWRRAGARDGSRPEPGLGQALTLLDRGDVAEAARLIDVVDAAHPGRVDVFDARAALAESQDDWPAALAWRQRALAQEPGRVESLRGLARAAVRLGAPQRALEMADAHAGLLDAPAAAAALADRTAIRVRWARIEAALETGSARLRWAGTALAASDEAAAALRSQSGTLDAASRRLLFDRLTALALCRRYAEARDLGAALQASGHEVPAWALGALAEAHLALREPLVAEMLYHRVLDADPDDADAALGLFHALVESERLDEAQAWIDAYAQHVSATAPRRRADARAAAALVRVYADRLQAAEALGAALLADAPLASPARAAWASVQAARGRPRLSDEELRRALALDPDNAALHAERVGLLIELQDFTQAQAVLAQASALQPDHVAVARARRYWELHSMRELDVEAGYGRASDGTPTGSRDWQLDATLWSQPFAQDWRAFLHDWRAEARFDGLKSRWHRSGIGIERRTPGWRWSAELAGGTPRSSDATLPEGTLQRRAGLTLRASWQPADAWSLDGSLDTLSPDVPLRARATGIRGTAASVGAQWARQEERRLSASISAVDFSDGNQRRSVALGWSQRWFSGPRLRLQTLATLYASRNSLDGAAYFNPSRDAAAGVDGIVEWLGWRRYEAAFRQRLVVTLGRYWQQGFGSGPVAALRWEHVWALDRTLQLRYGVGRAVRPYDGNTTGRNEAAVTLTWRF